MYLHAFFARQTTFRASGEAPETVAPAKGPAVKIAPDKPTRKRGSASLLPAPPVSQNRGKHGVLSDRHEQLARPRSLPNITTYVSGYHPRELSLSLSLLLMTQLALVTVGSSVVRVRNSGRAFAFSKFNASCGARCQVTVASCFFVRASFDVMRLNWRMCGYHHRCITTHVFTIPYRHGLFIEASFIMHATTNFARVEARLCLVH